MLAAGVIKKNNSTYKAVSERADYKALLATVAVMVDSNDVTRLKYVGRSTPQQTTSKIRRRTVISPVTGRDLYSSILS